MQRSVIAAFLLRRGYTPRYRGFAHLVEVLSFSTSHPGQLHSVMDVYRAAALRLGVSAASVEYNIRYLLESHHRTFRSANCPRPSSKVVIRRLTLELLAEERRR